MENFNMVLLFVLTVLSLLTGPVLSNGSNFPGNTNDGQPGHRQRSYVYNPGVDTPIFLSELLGDGKDYWHFSVPFSGLSRMMEALMLVVCLRWLVTTTIGQRLMWTAFREGVNVVDAIYKRLPSMTQSLGQWIFITNLGQKGSSNCRKSASTGSSIYHACECPSCSEISELQQRIMALEAQNTQSQEEQVQLKKRQQAELDTMAARVKEEQEQAVRVEMEKQLLEKRYEQQIRNRQLENEKWQRKLEEAGRTNNVNKHSLELSHGLQDQITMTDDISISNVSIDLSEDKKRVQEAEQELMSSCKQMEAFQAELAATVAENMQLKRDLRSTKNELRERGKAAEMLRQEIEQLKQDITGIEDRISKRAADFISICQHEAAMNGLRAEAERIHRDQLRRQSEWAEAERRRLVQEAIEAEKTHHEELERQKALVATKIEQLNRAAEMAAQKHAQELRAKEIELEDEQKRSKQSELETDRKYQEQLRMKDALIASEREVLKQEASRKYQEQLQEKDALFAIEREKLKQEADRKYQEQLEEKNALLASEQEKLKQGIETAKAQITAEWNQKLEKEVKQRVKWEIQSRITTARVEVRTEVEKEYYSKVEELKKEVAALRRQNTNLILRTANITGSSPAFIRKSADMDSSNSVLSGPTLAT